MAPSPYSETNGYSGLSEPTEAFIEVCSLKIPSRCLYEAVAWGDSKSDEIE